MEFDNPAAGGQWGSQHNSDSDFSDSETGGGSSKKEKTILGSAKKKDKEKKREKEKETKYAHLGEDSSNDDEDGGKGSTGKSKKKAFKIGLAKKEKKDKKEKEAKEKDLECKELKEAKDAKKKEKKEKPKLKLKKSKHTDSESDKNGKSEETKWPPIFGVPLQLAVDRNRCHDGIQLPVVVRECIDFIEEHGLHVEGIYRSSGVKSKIVKLRTAYSSRQPVLLSSADPPVVASLLKLFLRELPDPVLTQKLIPSFEDVSKRKVPLQRLEGLRGLLQELPEPNLRLIQWVFVHMGHVIKKEKLNKMTLQNVSIVLSPTMQISHRVLNCIFEHAEDLFAGVTLLRYIPPLCGPGAPLPESPGGIAEEMSKQESLLAELHREISSGLVVSRAREEQLWEQQRIVTQLKRNLRVAKSRQEEPVTYEEELNFALQTPLTTSEEGVGGAEAASGAGRESALVLEGAPPRSMEGAPTRVMEGAPSRVIEGAPPRVIEGAPPQVIEGAPPRVLSSPDDGTARSQEHRITVQIHQERRDAQAPQDSVREAQGPQEPAGEAQGTGSEDQGSGREVKGHQDTTTEAQGAQDSVREAQGPVKQESVREASQPHVTVIQLNPSVEVAEATAGHLPPLQPGQAAGETVPAAGLEAEVTRPAGREAGEDSSSCSPPARQTSAPARVEGEEERVRGAVSFSSTGLPSSRAPATAAIPLLPPPPPSSKTSSRAAPSQRGLAPPEPRLKSKSLPRGLPSDGVYDGFDHSAESAEEAKRSVLLLEEMRLRFELEEMMNLKSELERRRKTERREIAELQEEIATMQTLYQYRTYSVDSSEESSEEEAGRSQEQRAARLVILRRLVIEKKRLEASKVEMQDRLQEERAACLQLRVNIRMEQERIKRRAANF